MSQWTGILGIFFVLFLAYIGSNNRKAINFRIIFIGLACQFLFALFILKTSAGTYIFERLGFFIVNYIEKAANTGARFVFGFLANQEIITDKIGNDFQFIFFFNLTATIIFISLLVSILYYFGIMQRIIAIMARMIHKIVPISGSESISSIASAIVGQIEAQIMIKPYLKGMTQSELLCSMVGSLACISGSIMVAYISLGINPSYLMSATIMAIPGAILISKMVFPETEISETRGKVQLEVKQSYTNFLDAIAHGCTDGLKIAFNVAAMLIGFIALIKLINLGLENIYPGFHLNQIFAWIFMPVAWLIGVPAQDITNVSALLGTKLVINEFIAFVDLKHLLNTDALSPKSIAIASIALCSFANFGSIGIQIGGIGTLAPERRKDLAKLGFKALFCSTLVAYLSASIVGLIL